MLTFLIILHLTLFIQHYARMYITNITSISMTSEHKLVMVGLDNAGKTTILYQFLMNEVVHTSPTIGSNVEEVYNYCLKLTFC